MLTQFYLPFIGGEELLVRTLSVALVGRGHEVAIATLWHEGSPRYEVDRGVRIYRVRGLLQRVPGAFSDRGRRFAPPCPDPELTRAIRDVVLRERPDVVHAHNWMVYSFLPLKAWSGAKLVVSLHDYSLSCAIRTFMHHGAPCSGPGPVKCVDCAASFYGAPKGIPTAVAHRLMAPIERRMVDTYLPISGFVAAANGLPGSGLPYRVMPEFVADDLEELRGDGQPWISRLPGEDYLLFVGGFRRVKGIEVLLRAYAGLRDAPPLVVIGYTTPEPGGAIEFPANVTVLRDWPNDAIQWAWRRSLVALVPSVWPEPFGIVVLEAMAAGRPVVASRIGGLIDLVADGETGLLVPPGDHDALRAAIARLLADPALREAMGSAGRRRLDQFKASAVVARIEGVYRDVVGARGPAADRRFGTPVPAGR